MRRMDSHPGEYRKTFLANYLCIGFAPGGTVRRVEHDMLNTLVNMFVIHMSETEDMHENLMRC